MFIVEHNHIYIYIYRHTYASHEICTRLQNATIIDEKIYFIKKFIYVYTKLHILLCKSSSYKFNGTDSDIYKSKNLILT